MNHWWHHDRTGDKERVMKKGDLSAIHGSDAQMESGNVAQRVEERPASKEPEASDSDHAK